MPKKKPVYSNIKSSKRFPAFRVKVRINGILCVSDRIQATAYLVKMGFIIPKFRLYIWIPNVLSNFV